MSKRQIVILLGVWIIVLPFLGFPESWRTILFMITGLYLIIVAYRLQAESRKSTAEVPFVEHKATDDIVATVPDRVAEEDSSPAGPITSGDPKSV
jgi:hypothetical protein